MTIILKKHKSLYFSALKWFIILILILILGRLLVNFNPLITIASFFAIPFFTNKIGNFLIGAFGEYLVSKELKKMGENYFIINDLNLKNAQIDHVLVCPKGLFIIETKFYFGKVYGNGNEKYWKQYIGKNKFGISRYSPIKQALAHSIKLHEIILPKGLNLRIKTIVVFAGPADVRVNPRPVPVLYRKQLSDYLNNLDDILSEEEIFKINKIIIELIKK